MRYRYLADLDSYESPYQNMRIEGFRMLKGANLTIPEPLFIIREEAFETYKVTGNLSEVLIDELEEAARAILNLNPGKGIAVRRAFVIPGIPNPPGPRSGPIHVVQDVPKFVKKIFEFVREQLRDYISPDSHFACFMHPFINPEIRRGQAGCHAYLWQSQSLPQALVLAVYGNDEGVMELKECTDSYQINLDTGKYTSEPKLHTRAVVVTNEGARIRHISYKRVEGQSIEMREMKEIRDDPVLPDERVHIISNLLRRFSDMWEGQYRLEFSLVPDDIYFTECATYSQEEFANVRLPGLVSRPQPLSNFRMIGTVVKVLPNRELSSGALSDAKVVYVPNMKRDKMVTTTLRLAKNANSGVIVLFPGSLKSHQIVRLREFMKKEGKSVVVMSTNGKSLTISPNLSAWENILIEYDSRNRSLTFYENAGGGWRAAQEIAPVSVT